MASLNKVFLIGFVGENPRIIDANGSSTKVASFSLATTERGYMKRDGTKVDDKTEWHKITAFGAVASIIENYVHKGSKVFIEGHLNVSFYTDKDGEDRKDTKVIVEKLELLGSRQQSQQPAEQPYDDGDLPM